MARGCTCPVDDNDYGAGTEDGGYDLAYGCPLHWPREDERHPLERKAAELVEERWRSLSQQSRAEFDATAGPRPESIRLLGLSPPLPVDWPPAGRRRLSWYAYAERRPWGLMDAVEYSKPWLRLDVELAGEGDPVATVLAPELEGWEIQGVRALTAEEIRECESLPRASAHLIEAMAFGAGGEPARDIRPCFRLWALGNGVVVSVVRGGHRAFFRWLGL